MYDASRGNLVVAAFSRLLKKARNRLLARAAQKCGCVFARTYRAATVRERGPVAFFGSLLRRDFLPAEPVHE